MWGCRLGGRSVLVKSNTRQLTPSSCDGNDHRYHQTTQIASRNRRARIKLSPPNQSHIRQHSRPGTIEHYSLASAFRVHRLSSYTPRAYLCRDLLQFVAMSLVMATDPFDYFVPPMGVGDPGMKRTLPESKSQV